MLSNDDALDAFATYQRAAGLAETTVANQGSAVRSFASGLPGFLLEATLLDLRRYIGQPGDLKLSTRRTYQRALRAFYGFAFDDELRDDNPAASLKIIHVPKGEPRPFSPAQVERMLTSGAYLRTRVMILLGFYQGFRVAMIARVRGEDIDLEEMTIRTVGKGSKERTLPLHPMIATIAHLMPRKGWWFPARHGRPGHIHPGSVSDLIKEAKLRAGIDDPTLTAHSLRHGFGTELVEEGVDIRVVSELMLHEDLSSTQIYTRVSGRLKREGIRALPVRTIPQHSGRHAASIAA